MTTHRIIYEGPAALAVHTATALADAQGVELTSSESPARLEDGSGEVLLALTVKGSTEAVTAAVARIGAGLPATAVLKIDESPDGA